MGRPQSGQNLELQRFCILSLTLISHIIKTTILSLCRYIVCLQNSSDLTRHGHDDRSAVTQPQTQQAAVDCVLAYFCHNQH